MMSARRRVGLPAVLAIARHRQRSGGKKRGVLIWQMFRKIILAINKKKSKKSRDLVPFFGGRHFALRPDYLFARFEVTNKLFTHKSFFIYLYLYFYIHIVGVFFSN